MRLGQQEFLYDERYFRAVIVYKGAPSCLNKLNPNLDENFSERKLTLCSEWKVRTITSMKAVTAEAHKLRERL
jgi:hypothetical protein